jgi:dipeptidyl aminopeptidase/acylaminoacyl peptidase
MRSLQSRLLAAALLLIVSFAPSPVMASTAPTLEQMLSYPFVSGLVATDQGDRFAWVEDVRGVPNIWCAAARDTTPHQLTHYSADDGQEITQLNFTPDGSQLLYVRGGDHDQNWPAKGYLAPDPAANPAEAKIAIWSVATTSAASPVQVVEGDSPAISAKGQLAFIKDGQVWTAPLGQGSTEKPQRLFFDRGQDNTLVWSPDGSRLAFVSGRDDHSFVGVYTSSDQPLLYLAPSTSFDQDPVWSPDGRSIAFVRQPSRGDVKENFLVQQPHPFAIWTADASTGKGNKVWNSPDTLAGSLPDLDEDEPLFWMADNHLVFLAELDNWPHLYAVDTGGGSEPRNLTPGAFMVENLSLSPNRRTLVYSANAGSAAGDDDRRHLFRVGTDGHAPEQLTRGDGIEWSPAALADGAVAYASAGAQRPPAVAVSTSGSEGRLLDTGSAKDYPASALVTPRLVSFKSPDGLSIQGQLFQAANATHQPGVIFVHGGPPRQMLLGWHYRGYYSNSYAVNQYLATHGFTVLSVNYRLGIGYGRAFQHAEHAGPAGASEYQDVLAGARYLQHVEGVDAKQIGIWGGSYGGYLAGLALARNSDVFKAGVDFHGIFNWIPELTKSEAIPPAWYQVDAEWQKAVATAFKASPEADVATWKSPVLLIQGDDDRNVLFDQTVTTAHRLRQQHTAVEELVLPNEIHGFLRSSSWLLADQATVDFLSRQLRVKAPAP